MKIKAAVLRDSGRQLPYAKSMPLQIEDVELDPPGPDEVLMQIKAVGLCRSDLVAINGERGKPMPMVIGHEAAGIIMELGSNVAEIDVGDHVVPSYVSSCGRCDMCREGRPALCIPASKSNAAGTMLDGTTRLHQGGNRIFHHSGVAAFAEYAVISINAIVKIDKTLPFEQAALFGCGVCTGVGAVVNTANIRPGQTAAIVGLGGVGFSAMLAAIASGAGRVIAVDVNEDKLKLALELGAYKAVNAKDPDCIEQVRRATGGGVHIAVETAGVPQAL
jgi:alcohol dehydrogenase